MNLYAQIKTSGSFILYVLIRGDDGKLYWNWTKTCDNRPDNDYRLDHLVMIHVDMSDRFVIHHTYKYEELDELGKSYEDKSKAGRLPVGLREMTLTAEAKAQLDQLLSEPARTNLIPKGVPEITEQL